MAYFLGWARRLFWKTLSPLHLCFLWSCPRWFLCSPSKGNGYENWSKPLLTHQRKYFMMEDCLQEARRCVCSCWTSHGCSGTYTKYIAFKENSAIRKTMWQTTVYFCEKFTFLCQRFVKFHTKDLSLTVVRKSFLTNTISSHDWQQGKKNKMMELARVPCSKQRSSLIAWLFLMDHRSTL